MSVEISITDQIVEINETSNPVEIGVTAGAIIAPVWGGITGTLSNQTDLQNALNAKFDDPTGTTAQYIRGDGTLATFPTITSGTVTSVGLTMPSAFSVANSPVTSSGTLAVTGAGTTTQYIRGDGSLDTFPSLTGFVPYTGATANVDLGTHTILAQNATISSSGSGNTATITHSSGSGIGLNITKGGNGEGLYINKTSGSGNAATIIGTLNATTLVKSGGTSTQYLMADGSVSTLTNPITGTGAAGQVAYFTGATTQAGNNNLFWDATNNRLGIGTNAPSQRLDILGAGILVTQMKSNSASGASVYVAKNDLNSSFELGMWGSTRAAFGAIASDNGYLYGTTDVVLASATVIKFATGFGGVNPSERARIFATGNFGIGTGATDSGQRLQVVGDTLLKGSGTGAGTNALLIENSDGSDLIKFQNNGWIDIGNAGSGASMRMFPFTTTYGVVDLSGRNLQFLSYASTQSATSGAFYFTGVNFSQTSGTQLFTNIANGFIPTSGTATFALLNLNPSINQTGGANGITRGLYVNPTLTAAADWRSIEWSNNTGWGLYGAGTANNLLNGRLYIPIGSYDLPSLSFINDTNTGLFSPLADNLELKTGTNNAVVLENAATNLMAASEVLGAFPTNFQNIGISAPSPAVAAPDGALTANIAIPNTTSAQHRFFRSINMSEPNTQSVYAKAAGYNFISLAEAGGTSGSVIIFDLVNGTISGTAAGFSGTIENVGNGWFRCSLTRTATGAGANLTRWIIVRNANSTADYSGDGTSGVYLWGWQMETGLASTSYIATGASTVTRPQAVSILGSNLYGNLITRRVSAPSFNDFAIATDYTDRLIVKSSTGNVLIGSTTDSGEKLQVTGTMKVTGASSFGGNMTLSLNQNAATKISVSNTTSGTGSYSELSVTSTNGTGSFVKTSNGYTPYKIFAANDFCIINTSSAGDISILNDFATGNIKFAAGGSSTEQMRLTSAGNLCIGVTSGGDFLNIGAGTTAKAQINLASSTAPTSPNNGDIWFDGTDLKMRIGGVTKTFTLI
jgi:hypothetical protein